jgi:hypothetical protein
MQNKIFNLNLFQNDVQTNLFNHRSGGVFSQF